MADNSPPPHPETDSLLVEMPLTNAAYGRGTIHMRDAHTSSVAPVSRAVVLYGRVGTRAARAANMQLGQQADPLLWRATAETALEHVVAPWRRAGRVDIFVQSWNLDLAHSMDAYWKPVASEHAEQNTSLQCPLRLKLCERTMWALLGMKRALALRARWETSDAGMAAPPHTAVFVARHDVYWRSSLPPLRADQGVRLWLSFDCQVNYCREGAQSAPSTCDLRLERNATKAPSDWILLNHSKSAYFGVHCDAAGDRIDSLPRICANTVLIDWWFVGDRALVDGFGETFDQFERYSHIVQSELRLSVAAPHQYWGLYFFRTLALRDQCQVGHVLVHGLDFTLGRFIPAEVDARSRCSYEGDEWRPYWRPPTSSVCKASSIPGYLTSCPAVPPRPLSYVCREGYMYAG